MQAAAIAASAFAFAPAPDAIAQAPSAACRADLEAVDKSFKETIARLELVKNGTQAEKCAAYRSHVLIMERARVVFDHCNTGLTRRENVGQMNDSIEDFAELIKARCPAR